MKSYTIKKIKSVSGQIKVAQDKSITHRAFILASLSDGKSLVKNPLRSEDCMCTLKSLSLMGIKFVDNEESILISGVGLKGLKPPNEELYLGNSGTGFRLISGLLSGMKDMDVIMTGDESLVNRPMKRIIVPLREMGANITAREDSYPPLKINGKILNAISYTLPMASAQVKSAILLAGLNAKGDTKIVEPTASRDHTEKMLQYLGIKILKEDNVITLKPPSNINPAEFYVPSDISSAAFFIVLALIVGSSEGLVIRDVGVNPTRIGIIKVLRRMGADLEVMNERVISGEEVADLLIKKSSLKGTVIAGDEIPLLIDEIPILTLAGVFAEGETVIKDAKELRVKESDRINTIVSEFSKLGAIIEEREDGFTVKGTRKLSGSKVDSHKDHRIAMSLIIAGMIAEGETTVEDVECINTSFPTFFEIIKKLNYN